MKKKKWLWIILAIAAAVLLFPVRYELKDGGTVVYRAILYEIGNMNAMMDYTARGEFLTKVGFYAEILGQPVYDGTRLAKWSNGRDIALPSLPRGKRAVLRMLDDEGALTTIRAEDEVNTLADTFHPWMAMNGCRLSYEDPAMGSYTNFILSVGEDVTLWLGDIDGVKTYRFYFDAEDAPLPESWAQAAAEKECIGQAQAAFGAFEAFAASRDQAAELETIRALLPERAKDDAEDWYDMMLRSLWLNGDTAVTFSEIAIDEDDPNWVELILAGSDGKEYRLQGSSLGPVRAVFCNEKLYYGPFMHYRRLAKHRS